MDGEVLGGEGQKELAEMALETGRLPMRLDAADFADAERRKSILKDMLGGMGEHVHIDIDFRCEWEKRRDKRGKRGDAFRPCGLRGGRQSVPGDKKL